MTTRTSRARQMSSELRNKRDNLIDPIGLERGAKLASASTEDAEKGEEKQLAVAPLSRLRSRSPNYGPVIRTKRYKRTKQGGRVRKQCLRFRRTVQQASF